MFRAIVKLVPILALSAALALALAETYTLTGGQEVETLETFRECAACPEMIVLPLGRFTMGAPLEQSAGLDFWVARPAGEPRGLRQEGPEHEVEIDMALAMGRNEVTFDEWAHCVADGGCSHMPDREILIGGGRLTLTGGHPVVNVSWADAQEYAAWLNGIVGAEVYRLPTEAEWEYAARAGTETIFAQGDRLNRDQARFLIDVDQTEPVVPLPVDRLDAANSWGLRHMSGNVLERTLSCWSERHLRLPTSSLYLIAALGSDACSRVVKGGAYNAGANYARPAARGFSSESFRGQYAGFRLARTFEQR